MDLQKFGVDIYLIQVIFGAVDIPAKVVVTVSMSIFGRRPSQCAALILSGVTILINILVPNGEVVLPVSGVIVLFLDVMANSTGVISLSSVVVIASIQKCRQCAPL